MLQLRTIFFRRGAVFGVSFAADPVGQWTAPPRGAVDSRALLRLLVRLNGRRLSRSHFKQRLEEVGLCCPRRWYREQKDKHHEHCGDLHDLCGLNVRLDWKSLPRRSILSFKSGQTEDRFEMAQPNLPCCYLQECNYMNSSTAVMDAYGPQIFQWNSMYV